ncbi:Uncharacterized protein Rs2_35209 [Raphanus sativus]|nr:Uncharacterized protein Rs2_35209 [Raphanus sativus]
MVDIPDLENHDLIEESISSVIVNGLNPLVHKIGGLVKTLPPIYELEDCVRGRRMDCCSRSMDTKPQSRFLVQDPFWIRLEKVNNAGLLSMALNYLLWPKMSPHEYPNLRIDGSFYRLPLSHFVFPASTS